ncbi:MAG: hypothetical protein WC326_12465 [Candidatus Delongbacteria bacterium]
MPPLAPAALAAIAPELAKRGLDLLSGVFRGGPGPRLQETTALILERTGIDIHDVAEQKLSPEQWGSLKEFELQQQDRLLESRQESEAGSLEREQLAAADRADARSLQRIALSSDDVVARRFIYYYATLLTLLTFAFIFYAAFGPENRSESQQRIIDTVLGFLLGVSLSAIIQYFFGSSVGSKDKDEKMSQIRRQLPAATAPGGARSARRAGDPA